MFNNIAIAADYNDVSSSQNPFSANGLVNFLPFVMIFIVFYFMLIKPQMKKQKEHQNLLSSIKKNDKIVTNGGIIGTVTKIEDDATVTIEIAPDVKIKIMKANIVDMIK